MPEAPPHVAGANERTPTDYPKHGSTLREPPLFASERLDKIHEILDKFEGDEAVRLIREVLYAGA